MNNRKSKFSKHLQFLQLSYYHYSTCAISGTGGSTIWKYSEVLLMSSYIIFPFKIMLKLVIVNRFSKYYVLRVPP